MSRSKRTSYTRCRTPVRASRIHAHISPTYNVPRQKRRAYLQKNSGLRHDRKDDNLEDAYRPLMRGTHGIEADGNTSPDGTDSDASSNDEEWNETTLFEMLSSPSYSEEQILHNLSRVFADTSQAVRKEVVLGLRPVLSSARNARPAPGHAFITGLLGFDDACKRFEKNSYRTAELDTAYAKIEDEIRELFERLQVAHSRLEERRVAFQKQVKEQANKMREIISMLPADVDTLIAKLERKSEDVGKEDGSAARTKRRERTVEGALAGLQL
ncbi:hypothetical protein BJV78DRAFT_187311 [Lactifluus subvellereus]|nr:hypothetical protein BJV78DRAFT_187311 [Lactifluus subvellereus]